MGLFDKLKTKTTAKTTAVAACVGGKVVAMKDIGDPVFADGILGFCVGIEPDGESIAAPADGVITQIADSFHAIGMKTKDGAEILIHVGIDTVQMMGDGFAVLVHEGAEVRAGQKILTFDRGKIREAGYSDTVVTAVTNTDDLGSVSQAASGTVRVGDTVLMIAR